MSAYYSDRVRGPRARSEAEIDETLWEAFRVLFERGVDTAFFAKDFPLACAEGRGICGCDRDGLLATIRVEIPELFERVYFTGAAFHAGDPRSARADVSACQQAKPA